MLKRLLITAILAIIISCGGSSGSSSSSSDDNNNSDNYTTLKAATESRNGIKVGSLYNNGVMSHRADGETYLALLADNFNMMSLEYSVAMREIWQDENTIDFTYPDEGFDFARENGMTVRLTHLVWYETLPEWLTTGSYTDDEVADLIQWYIEQVMTHYITNYPEVEIEWNVANEPVSPDVNFDLRQSFLTEKLGDDWVARVFQWADAVDSDAKLFINEYGALGASTWNNHRKTVLKNLVQDLIDRNIHIDGIGFQGHLYLIDYEDDIEAIKSDFAEFAALGLELEFTELDITMNNDLGGYTEEKADLQAQFFTDIYQLCVDTPQCTAVSLWGLSDDISFINTDDPAWLPQDEDWPLLFDADLNKKDVYWDIIDILLTQ